MDILVLVGKEMEHNRVEKIFLIIADNWMRSVKRDPGSSKDCEFGAQ